MGGLLAAGGAGLVSLLTVLVLTRQVLKKDPGSERMQELSRMVQVGASAFLKREYQYVAIFVVGIAALMSFAPVLDPDIQLGWQTAAAFACGAVVSALAGFVGMSIATRANCRTTHAAESGGLAPALDIAISGGAVMGFSVVGLSLLGLVFVYYWAEGSAIIVNGYAMGASLVALFARSGGGIYTKGADMGADLVGKVEAGIPEDDPRNPAVIADNVGDNVGDVAGLGSDLLESYVESIIACMAIISFVSLSVEGRAESLKMLPMYIAAAGVLGSIVGLVFIKLRSSEDPQQALMQGTYMSAVITILLALLVVKFFGTRFNVVDGDGNIISFSKYGPFWAVVLGIVSGNIVGFVSEYFTSSKFKPVKILASGSESGAAITVTEGIAVGMQSTTIPVLVIAIAMVFAFKFAGMYGVAMAAFGMLATTGIVVSVDSYGPIADNAGGIAEMAELKPEVRQATDKLDSVGNTTAAIGKGFAIGSAAFAAMGLIAAYLGAVRIDSADLKEPRVLAGVLIGAMLPFFFSSMLFRAVSKSAFKMIEEVRRQFREIPGLMEGKAKPDPARCVDISTRGAINGMLVPGALAICMPAIVGFTMGKECLAGMLVGALASGLMLGIQMANSGGAMDNAKKYIEEGHHGGKGSEAHKAAVVGDTVGDPLKDTVGPSINIFIKLMAVISLVLAPIL